MNEPSSIDAIIVEGGPRSGIWFRSHADLSRFLQHPDIIKAEGQATMPGLGALNLLVADEETWGWLEFGVTVTNFGDPVFRHKYSVFRNDPRVRE